MGNTDIGTKIAELKHLHERSTQGEWEFAETHGVDCIWLDVVAGDAELMSAETAPQEHIVHISGIEAIRKAKGQSVSDLQFISAAHNALPDILRELEASQKRLVALITNRWVVNTSPAPQITGAWICGNPSAGWPACIAGSGSTPEAAVDAAIEAAIEAATGESPMTAVATIATCPQCGHGVHETRCIADAPNAQFRCACTGKTERQ